MILKASAFRAVKTTVRTIHGFSVERENDLITMALPAADFYTYGGILAGTLMEIGGGAYPPVKMQEILAARDRKAAGPTAPARGLTLIKIDYKHGKEEE
ncbi:MAG: hypothetical protein ACLRMZ_02015 [Blautia marasmi]